MVVWTPHKKMLRVRNLMTDEDVGKWRVNVIEERKMAISLDGKTVVWGRSRKFRRANASLTVLKIAPGSKPKTFGIWVDGGKLGWLALSPDGKQLAVKGAFATDLIDLTMTGSGVKKIRRLPDWGPDKCGSFSHNGRWLAVR